MTRQRNVAWVIVMMVVVSAATGSRALAQVSEAHREKARQVLEKAYDFLRAQQNDDGSWAPDPGPAITAMIVTGMLADPAISRYDPAVQKALTYILSHQKDNGGIYERLLPNYNTAIALTALGQLQNDPEIRQAILQAQDFLTGLQWNDQVDPSGTPITQQHPWYGGVGYGGHGRPDLSNTQTMLEGLYASGFDCRSPVFQRAMVFVSRLQGAKTNTLYGDQIVPDGGFIYATSTDKDHIGQLQSYAVPPTSVDEYGNTRLRTYGSMTYAGFKSYVYALLDRDDPRVQAALEWIQRNYTLEENPNTGMQGYYYYLQVFAKALDAWDEPTLELADGRTVNWGQDLIDKLATLQRDDGSFVNEEDRWMEDNPVLCTAYAIQAIHHALN